MGNGMIEGVKSIVYVRPDKFDSFNNPSTVDIIRRINDGFAARGEGYILIGPGRWGSSDPALGIPVRWTDISAARLIAEASLPGYRIEPSQGTHFFQNLTSFGVAYFTIDQEAGEGLYDSAYLDSCPAVYDDGTVRVVTFDTPLAVAVNGRSGLGTVAKPGIDSYNNLDNPE